MSVSIGGKIVTDGLVIHYDALNKRSYRDCFSLYFFISCFKSSSVKFNISIIH
jgi:hypothetical protein